MAKNLILRPLKILVIGLVAIALTACGAASPDSQSQPTIPVAASLPTSTTPVPTVEKTILEPTTTATIPESSPTPTLELVTFAPTATPAQTVAALSGMV